MGMLRPVEADKSGHLRTIFGREHALNLVLILVSGGFLLIVLPFAGAVLWAVIASISFHPMYRRLGEVPGIRPSGAALLTVAAIFSVVVLPSLLLGVALIDEAGRVAERIRSGQIDIYAAIQRFQAGQPRWLVRALGLEGVTDLRQAELWIADGVAGALRSLAAGALGLGQRAFGLLIGIGVTLYLSFFFLRDGLRIAEAVEPAIPLPPNIRRTLLKRFVSIVHATVKGSLMVAVLQGVVGGTVFWALGLHAPLLWGTAMGVMSLLPAIGTGIVWMPVAIFLLATGAVWQGIALALCGIFVISMVDNLVRPILVGRDARMPDYVVFVSTLGGLEVFGFNGFIIGPIIAGLFLSAWQLRQVGQAPIAHPTDPQSPSPRIEASP
jgi:predicted PurR-regulated permease PerM